MYSEHNSSPLLGRSCCARKAVGDGFGSSHTVSEIDFSGPLGISSVTTVTSPELNREILFSSDILTVTNILLQLGPQ